MRTLRIIQVCADLLMSDQCAGAGSKAMINKMTLFPRLNSNGQFQNWATDSILSSYFEGSDDGTTYTKILTVQDEPPQVG